MPSVHATAIGFNMEVVEYKNIKFNVWDLGGQDSIVCDKTTTQHGLLTAHRVVVLLLLFVVVVVVVVWTAINSGHTGDTTMRAQTRL